MINQQFELLKAQRVRKKAPPPTLTALSNGSFLIQVPDVELGPGWNREKANVLFVAPPGYPAAQPDCFWVEPSEFRLAGNGTPQASNDASPIPSDVDPGRRTTWFSWHLQTWDPNSSSLVTYLEVIMNRLKPAR